MPDEVTAAGGQIRARRIAQKANQALLDGSPLVIESEDEIRAVRSWAERDFGFYGLES